MKQFILVISIVFSFQVFSQTKCDIQSHYGDFIKISKKTYNGREYIGRDYVKVDNQYCFADYVNNNLFYFICFILFFS